MSLDAPTETQAVVPPFGGASADEEGGPGEFSPEQLVLINRLVTARVAMTTAAGSANHSNGPSTSSCTETGECPVKKVTGGAGSPDSPAGGYAHRGVPMP